jgi:DNA repair exonuclease SbcCD nuclease subunit
VLRFVHTGDWQLGMRRHFLSPEAQARYDEARLEAVRAIARVAVGEGCGFVVVAGDVFDSNFVDRQVLGRALEALRAFTVPVYLLPGNHDALDAASVYRRPSFAERRPPLVRVLDTADPVSVPGIDEAVEVVGVPWRTRRPSEDLVGLACAGLGPPRGLRVLVAHGAVDALSPDGADPARIRLAALEQAIEAGLVHYAALGDRHSVTGVGSTGRVFYAGTPLVTDYDEVEPNHVLVVTLDDGGLAVERRRVGSWSFVSRRIAVDGEEGVDALSASLEAMPDKETSVVELELVGTVGLGAKARLDELLEDYGAVFASLRVSPSRSDLAVLPDQADLDELGLVGFAAEALEELRAQATSGSETARDALCLLYRLAGGGRARGGSSGSVAAHASRPVGGLR